MAEWILAAIALISMVASAFMFVGGNQQWRKSVDERLELHAKYHKDHYQHAKDDLLHFQDTEIHWTSRERNELNRRLDRQEQTQQEILKEIRELGQRLYDK